MSNYTALDERLTGRCKLRRKIANNTYAERRGEAIAVRLHDTDVVTFHPNGDIQLNTGGWFTVTTKERMNSMLPHGTWEADYCDLDPCPGEYAVVDGSNHFHGRHVGMSGSVSSHRGEWFVHWGDHTRDRWSMAGSFPYRDGMILHPDGTVSGVPEPTELEIERIARKEMHKAIKKFLAGITPERIITAWENSEGDCWGCKMRADDGTFPMGHSCLGQHVEEDYFHASLAYRAICNTKRGNPAFCMQLIYASAKHGRVDSMLTHDLRRLLKKHLIEGVATR